jgi:membrane-associated phospholipid phosphatase
MNFFSEKEYAIFETGKLFFVDQFFVKFRLKIKSKIFDKTFQFISVIDSKAIFWITYIAMILFFFSINKMAILFICLLISDQSCRWLLKKNIRRLRPFKWYYREYERTNKWTDEIDVFKHFSGYSPEANSSMCSSHAANFLGQGLIIYYFLPSLGLIILPFFILIGIARWFIGAHWFSDIIVGWIVGFLSFQVSIYLFEMWFN